jgi:hypothetical protein
MTNNKHPYIEALVGVRAAESIIERTIREYLVTYKRTLKSVIKDWDPEVLESNFLVPPRGVIMWHCASSPIYTCVYDNLKDPAHDHCVFCGLPEERK